MTREELKSLVRDVPNFPKKGIVFKDITTILKDKKALKSSIRLLMDELKRHKIDKVAGIESRGFIHGTLLAYELGAGFVPIRKPGKLPAETLSQKYKLEYGHDSIEIHKDAISPGEKVVVFDDLLATGGTAEAACELVEKLGGDIVLVAFLIELKFLKGREKLGGREIFALLDY